MNEKKKMIKTVLSYPKLAERLEEKSLSNKAEAIKYLNEIAADLSMSTMHMFKRFLDNTLSALYDGVNLSTPSDMDFKELVKTKNVVLVPNHQSHADYLALNYIVFSNFKIPLYVAGGINLNIFPIGKLFRKSGCFFIRRSFSSNILYKLVLEGYLYYLLIEGLPIEFFFEGGRSRTGRLLPPKYGLYQMLLEAHKCIPEDVKRELIFVPTSIIHEYVPEQKSLAKELKGGKKTKENSKELLKLFKLISKQFGNIHLSFGKPVTAHLTDDIKRDTQNLAFDCFREVGRQMKLTPTSLLCMLLLDEPSGAIGWEKILDRGKQIIDFCEKFNIPYSKSLTEAKFTESMERAIDILISNNKVNVIGRSSLGHLFYSIKHDSRMELLYFKNSIIHHFLVPWIINTAWINIFNGSIKTVADLKRLFLQERSQLKHEFYLPTVKEFLYLTLKVISDCIGREVNDLEECVNLSHQELYQIATKLGVFSRCCSFILEGYYNTAITLKKIGEVNSFDYEAFQKLAKSTFESELKIGRVIKHNESFSVPLLKSSMKYFEHQGVVKNNQGQYEIIDFDILDSTIESFDKDLKFRHSFNIKGFI